MASTEQQLLALTRHPVNVMTWLKTKVVEAIFQPKQNLNYEPYVTIIQSLFRSQVQPVLKF